MSALNLFPVFLIGVLGSVHCVGMCGGIVSAIATVSAPAKRFPVAVISRPWGRPVNGLETAVRVVSYNLGRISSYAIAGAIAGGVARSVRVLAGVSTLQMDAYWLANLILVALGLYLTGWWRGIAYLEYAGYTAWKKLQPLTKKLLPLDTPWKMLAAGGIWGWLPCGMVYSMLFTALLSGSAVSGALTMFAFGLGTLPTLMIMGVLGEKWKLSIQHSKVRIAGGMVVIFFGLLGLFRAAHGMPATWLDALCVSPSLVGAIK